MKFKEIGKRLTGFSIPVIGVSWNPDNTSKDIAKRVISFLEDRRVLYYPGEMELPHYCVSSIIEIRRFLTEQIPAVSDKNLQDSLKAMRNACRKFLDIVDEKEEQRKYGGQYNNWANWVFFGAIGEVRGVFGIHIAKIAASYKLDIENDLASILPDIEDDGVEIPEMKKFERYRM